jgi:hypothetical protein
MQDDISALGFAHRIVTLETENRTSDDHGSPALSQPERHADRNLLWWNTSNGWIFTDSMEAAPETGLAFVSAAGVTPWTLAYLTSLAVAPPMPVWHHQPTPRPSRSL